ncbi:hypothetical protein [Streptomyces yaizuensis]|uniref:Portal protein n=1 Tax=Streptomyces yaizuensis TaxID=2989713 RepID=A0AA86MBH2_9ACTN|nr:hypothetical protein [Streptomyces sp. YSPA8]BDT39518.1 hypothetical protein SYYSPA8_37000 [Streptomyces sp. YSPA8]
MPPFLRHERPQPELDEESGAVVDTGRTRILASAALVTQDQVHAVTTRRAPWQPEAWDRYDEVPELRSGTDWLANACSRVRFYAGRIDADGSTVPEPVTEGDPDAERLLQPLDELFNAGAGQAEMIRRWVTHLEIPGESFLAGFTDPHLKARRWLAASGDELRTGIDGRPEIQLPETIEWVPLNIGSPQDKGDASALIRLWQPHARRAIDPDSSIIALRGVLRQILALSAHINASADSRLAGAGLLGIPDDLTVVGGTDTSDGPNPLSSSPLVRALMESMIAPIKDRGLAGAVVPLMLTGSAESIAALKHLTFATPFDERVGELLEKAIRRLATGLSIPAEILLGLGNGTYWNSFLIKDEAIQVAVAPRVELLCEALTHHFYRPMLQQLGVGQPEEWGIGYDITALSQRPDRAPEAEKAHTSGVLSDAALLRELGFDEEDMPKEEERKRRLREKIALANPALAPQMLRQLGIDVEDPAAPEVPGPRALEPVGPGDAPALPPGQNEPAEGAADNPQQDPATARPVPPEEPSLPGPRPGLTSAAGLPPSHHGDDEVAPEAVRLPGQATASPTTSEPVGELVPAAPVTAAATAARDDEWQMRFMEFATVRALERSGQWLLNSYGRGYRGALQEVPLAQIHTHLKAQPNWHNTMLAGAYRELTALATDQPWMIDTVDRYVRALLAEGVPHHRDYLLMALEQTAEAAAHAA